MASTPDHSIGFTREEVEEVLAAQKAELKRTLAAWLSLFLTHCDARQIHRAGPLLDEHHERFLVLAERKVERERFPLAAGAEVLLGIQFVRFARLTHADFDARVFGAANPAGDDVFDALLERRLGPRGQLQLTLVHFFDLDA